MREEIKGRVWKFGDDINTDVIFPGKYTYTVTDATEMAKHALEDALPEFAKEVRQDDIIVAGKNFGCGSSREQAALCLKAAGVGAVVAKSFSRIYYRNAINLGLPIVVCPQLSDIVKQGDEVTINFTRGVITFKGVEYAFPALNKDVAMILDAGGLIPWVRAKIAREKQ